MKPAERIKLLKQYSGRKTADCDAALTAAGNDFWKALYRLSTPTSSRAELLLQLNPRDPENSAAALDDLRRWFSCEPCEEAWMRIEDEDLQAEYPESPVLPMQEHEFAAILNMLEACKGGDLVCSGLEMYYYWEGILPARAVSLLLHWVKHYDQQISESALRVFASFPESVPAAFDLFQEILLDKGDPRRYDLAWTLWTLAGQGNHYPEMKIGYMDLLRTGSEAEKEFARDLLAGIA